jgi:hypothetical protein
MKLYEVDFIDGNWRIIPADLEDITSTKYQFEEAIKVLRECQREQQQIRIENGG